MFICAVCNVVGVCMIGSLVFAVHRSSFHPTALEPTELRSPFSKALTCSSFFFPKAWISFLSHFDVEGKFQSIATLFLKARTLLFRVKTGK